MVITVPWNGEGEPPALTPSQRTRLEFARRDLESARATDLAVADPPALILLVERLRGRLNDVLDLVDEVTST